MGNIECDLNLISMNNDLRKKEVNNIIEERKQGKKEEGLLLTAKLSYCIPPFSLSVQL